MLESNAWLNDQIVYIAQKLLQQEFPSFYGLQFSPCDHLNGSFKPIPKDGKYIQIKLTRGKLGSGGAEFVGVYDSLWCLFLDHKL